KQKEKGQTGSEDNQGKKSGEDAGGPGKSSQQNKGDSPQTPSLMRILIYSGIVALVCGIIGAGGITYFFGGSRSEDEKGESSGSSKGGSSKGGSSSSKESSSEDSSQGSGTESGSGSDPGSGSDTSKNSVPGSSPESKKKSDSARILRAEDAWMMAIKELDQA